MKKISQTQQTIVDARIKEINTILNDSMTRMSEMLKQPQPNLKEITNQLNNMAGFMSREINRRLLEMKSLVPAPKPPGTSTTTPPPAAADDQTIPGGMGSDLSPEDVDAKQLEMGVKVELEHTGDRDMAQEIALDHLAEDPEYYTKLKKVHQDTKDRHLGPRGKAQNPKLPDFWRRNLDYGESPYLHMDKLKTITDKPSISKRKRKKKK